MTKTSNSKYRIRNWKEYNKALVNRGSLTVWFSSDILEKWSAETSSKRGRPKIYSDEAILCALMIKAVYKLPFRALRGLMLSMVALLGLSIQIPCYTRVCRRAAELGQEIKRFGSKKVTDIVFDSSGLKVSFLKKVDTFARSRFVPHTQQGSCNPVLNVNVSYCNTPRYIRISRVLLPLSC